MSAEKNADIARRLRRALSAAQLAEKTASMNPLFWVGYLSSAMEQALESLEKGAEGWHHHSADDFCNVPNCEVCP